MSMKRLPKCNACRKIAKEEHGVRRISESYLYKIIREQCTHTEEERNS